MTADDLAFYGLKNERRTEDGSFTVFIPSSRGANLTAHFNLAVGWQPEPEPSDGGSGRFTTAELVGSIVGAFAVGVVVTLLISHCIKRREGVDSYQHMVNRTGQ